MEKLIVIGSAGNKTISKVIEQYRSEIPEQILTTKRSIRQEFKNLGYNPQDVIFNV